MGVERAFDEFPSEASFIANGLNGKKSGNGFIARCPAHDDTHASLSIAQQGDKVLFKCQAQCTQSAVLDALRGLNLWRARPSTVQPKTYYVYNDRQGNPTHRTVRLPGKKFWQEHRIEGNRWGSGLGARSFLYHVDELMTRCAESTCLAEGEKDVDRLRSFGFLGTCNPMGAGKWRPEYAQTLSGRDVVIFYDRDSEAKKFVGQEHAKTVALSLIGTGCRVRIVDLPEGKDISDYLDLGHKKEDVQALIAKAQYVDEGGVIAWFAKATLTNRPPVSGTGGEPASRFALTELGLAERLVRDGKGHVRYCHPFGQWYVFNGSYYCPDTSGEMVRRVKATIRSIPEEAAIESRAAAELRSQAATTAGTVEERKVLLENAVKADKRAESIGKFAIQSESAQRINNAVLLARAETGVPVAPSDLDSDPWLLNLQNGVFDLRAFELLPHSPTRLITKVAPVSYDPAARCPAFLRFLGDVFPGPHSDVIPFLQRALGYSMTGSTKEECFFVLYGIGRNGKGVLVATVSSVLGGYAGTSDFSTFIQRRDDGAPREDIAAMAGKYFIAAQESREGAAFAESVIKGLTGGDMIRARRLHENGFEFRPTHKIWLATNHKPNIRGTDIGIWSRVRLVPFTVSFEGRENKNLKNDLLNELPGILNWLIEGCLQWQKEGLGLPESVAQANKEYRSECDQLQRFFEDECEFGDYFTVAARDIYLAYKKWCDQAGEQFLTETAFGRRMGERGFDKTRQTTGNRYQNVRLALHEKGAKIDE